MSHIRLQLHKLFIKSNVIWHDSEISRFSLTLHGWHKIQDVLFLVPVFYFLKKEGEAAV